MRAYDRDGGVELGFRPARTNGEHLFRRRVDDIHRHVPRHQLAADQQPIERRPVNIHRVLEHVRRLAGSGFARSCRIVESYDPSLPAVHGNRNLLVQVFLNLMKNAAEAAPSKQWSW